MAGEETFSEINDLQAGKSTSERVSRKSITDIVDVFEQQQGIHSVQYDTNAGRNLGDGDDRHAISGNGNMDSSKLSRFQPIKSLRRNVKKPVSYAEPALNTKLRRGDTFFPKMSDQNQMPNAIQPAVVSPEPTVT